jgi:hypothetical protein
MLRNRNRKLGTAGRNVCPQVTRTLRFDEDLRQQLEEAASRSDRSVNAEIVFRLRTTLKQEACRN